MADVKKVVKYCKMTGYCAHDYETSGHLSSDHRGYPTCISIAFQPGYAYVIPLAHKDSPLRKGNKWKRILKYIGRELIQNDRIVKVAHNFKFEHGWWLKYGIRPRGVILDTMLMKYLLNEKRPHDLKSLAYSFFPQYANYSIKGEDTERTPEEVVQFWSNVPLETLAPYNALDSDLCLRLAIYLEQRIRECGFYQLYRNLLEMASYNLAEVESRGYLVDRPYLDGLCESYKTKIEEAEAKMYAVPSLVKYNKKRVKAAKKALLDGLLEQIEIKTNELDSTTDKKKLGSLQRSITNLQKKYDNYSAGVGLTKKDKESLQPLNLKSVKQLIDFLYYNKYGLRLPIIKYTEDKKTKKPTKNPATSEDVLLELKDKDETGFIETLLKYREITKLYSTYIVGIRDTLNPDNTLHGSFLIHGTVTGRLSSRNPNLQNMPRDTTAKDIKYMFVCPKGKVMMQLDYSQAELRVVAGWSQDKQMLEWFRVGHDIHLATACKKYKISYEDAYKIYSNEDDPDFKIWKVRRKQAKTIGFGVLYQQGPNHLKESLSTPDHKATKEEAIEFLDEWFDTFPRIRKFVKKQQKFAEEHGYIVSPFGRKRRLPEARNKREQGKYAKALRDAVNAPIQGTASDFALFSSILIREQIMQGKLPASIEQIGTIHDSLMFYLDPKDMNDEVVDHLFNICKDPDTQKYFGFKLKGITMAVDFELGLRWSKLKGYKRGTDYAEVYKDCYIDHWWENKEIVALQEAS
jgi:DNA polymerase I-like protein with 3'-5' exonuclease and polymerase domains